MIEVLLPCGSCLPLYLSPHKTSHRHKISTNKPTMCSWWLFCLSCGSYLPLPLSTHTNPYVQYTYDSTLCSVIGSCLQYGTCLPLCLHIQIHMYTHNSTLCSLTGSCMPHEPRLPLPLSTHVYKSTSTHLIPPSFPYSATDHLVCYVDLVCPSTHKHISPNRQKKT